MGEERSWRRGAAGPVAIIAGMLTWLAATNRWRGWQGGLSLMHAGDELDYRRIAAAAPQLPGGHGLGDQHAQRFAVHWTIGVLAHAVGLAPTSAYFIAVGLLILIICGLLWWLMVAVGLARGAGLVCVGVLVLNAYSFRYYLLAPGYVADLVFVAAMLIVLIGLFRRRLGPVVLGILLGALARQTTVVVALALVPVLALWPDVSARRGWRVAARGRCAIGIGLLALAGAAFAIEVAVARHFSHPTTPSLSHWTVLGEIERLPAGAGRLAGHLLRSVNSLFTVAVLLLVAVRAWTRRSASAPATAAGPWARRVAQRELLGCLLLAAAICLQPAIFSAGYASGNEPRLAVLGLAPGVAALAVALREAGAGHWRAATLLPMLGILAVGSLHHIFTWFGTGFAAQTVLLEAVCALALGALAGRALAPRGLGAAAGVAVGGDGSVVGPGLEEDVPAHPGVSRA